MEKQKDQANDSQKDPKGKKKKKQRKHSFDSMFSLGKSSSPRLHVSSPRTAKSKLRNHGRENMSEAGRDRKRNRGSERNGKRKRKSARTLKVPFGLQNTHTRENTQETER